MEGTKHPVGDDGDPSRSGPWGRRLLRLFLPGVLALSTLAALGYAALALGFRWEILPGEGLNAFFLSELAEGRSIYVQWADDRLFFPIYPPGFYWASTPLALLADYELWPGRLLSISAYAFAAYAAYRVARRLGADRVEGLLAGAGLFTFYVAVILLPAGRPDGLALAFGAAALWAIVSWEDETGNASLGLAALATVGMIVTKQNFAPLALGLLVGIALRDRRSAIAYAFLTGLGVAVVVAIAELTTGSAFLESMRDFSGNSYSPGALREALTSQLLPYPSPILALAAAEAVLALLVWRRARTHIWFFLSSFLVLASAVKLGSSGNYWLPVLFASSILAALAFARLRRVAPTPALIASGAVAVILAPGAIDRATNLPGNANDLDARRVGNEQAASLIASREGPLFGDRPDLAVRGGRAPSFDAPPFVLLDDSGRWDPAPVADEIRAGTPAVVQSMFDLEQDPIASFQGQPLWPIEIVQAVRESYCPLWASATASIYLYRRC